MYKSAFLGCGPRAKKHAQAYRHVERGKPVAACDVDAQRLAAFGDEFGIDARFTDIHEMLDRVSPDLLHVVTPPGLRVPLMTIASEHKVPVVIVEKPIAVQGEDWRQLRELDARSSTRFVVNTQLHFHPRNLELKRVVAGGEIGEIRFIDVSARSTILDQGVHVLELAHSYNGYSAPTAVFAQASGARTLTSKQPSPDTAEASMQFANGIRAHMVTGDFAPRAQDNEIIYRHKRIAVYGTGGFVQWTMAGWECRTERGGYESGTHSYDEQDELGQAALTDSAFGLLQGKGEPHPTRLELSLVQFNVILGAYVSTLERRPVALPCEPPDDLIARLKEALS